MKQRMESIDIIRGITILLVVIAHSPDNFIGNSILKNFRMPLFFIVSGYLFSYIKYNKNFKLLLRDKFRTLIIPYFAFSILGGLLWSFKHIVIDYDFSFTELLYGIINANGVFIKGNTPIWFLNCLFFTTIFLYIGLRFTNGVNKSRQCLLIFFGFGVIGSLICRFIWLPWSIDVALVAALFMFIGFNLKQQNLLQKIPLNVTSLTIGILCFSFSSLSNVVIDMNGRVYGNLILFYLSGISGSFIVYWIIEKILIKFFFLNAMLKNIGKESLIILGFHAIFIPILAISVSYFTNQTNFQGAFLFYSLISILMCKFISLLIRNSPIFLYLFKGAKLPSKKND